MLSIRGLLDKQAEGSLRSNTLNMPVAISSRATGFHTDDLNGNGTDKPTQPSRNFIV